MLNQKTRFKLQSLIHNPEITLVSINDANYSFDEHRYTYVNIQAECSLAKFGSIVSGSGINLGPAREFECEHDNYFAVGHSIDGEIEGCRVSCIVTKRIKKEAPQQEGAQEKNFTSDYTTDSNFALPCHNKWTCEECVSKCESEVKVANA